MADGVADLAASVAIRHPGTATVMNLVAPSPSRTMACASHGRPDHGLAQLRVAGGRCIGESRAGLAGGDEDERIVGRGIAVDRDAVEGSVGGLLLASCCSSGWAMPASVATKPSIVAMFGLIMPAPLEMPVMVMVLSPTTTRREAAWPTVSVVMMAWAAAPGCRPRSAVLARQAGDDAARPATVRGSRRWENGSTCASVDPEFLRDGSTGLGAAASPWVPPEPALAMPVLMTSARMLAGPEMSAADLDWGGAEAVL